MDTIAKTIKRLVKREYGRPAPKHFQRAARELLRWAGKTMRDSLEAEASKGQKIPLSKTAIGHFPIEDWDWGAPSEPVLTSTVEHFKRELPLVVRTLPDAFAVDVPRNTYLTLARGAVHWYKDTPGPLTAYYLYLTPGEVEELKRIDEKWRRDLFISTKYTSHSLYSTSWPLTWYGVDYTRTLYVSFGPIQVQEAKRWAHLVVSFHVSTFRKEIPSMGPDGKYETLEEPPVPPPELTAEELAPHIAELEDVLAGRGPTEGPQTGELFRPGEVEKTDTTKLPAVVMRHIQHFTGDLAPLFNPENPHVPDFIADGERRRQMQEGLDAGEIIILHDGSQMAWEMSRQYVLDLGEKQQASELKALQKKHEKIGRPLDNTALEKMKPSKDDIIRAGLSEISLGILGTEIQFALLHLAWQQRNDGHLGLVKLKSWNQLCRTINPDFDKLKRGPRNNYRRRVKRKVIHMTRLRSLWTYNQLGRERLIDTLWVSFLDDETPGGNTVYIRPGLFDNLYVVAVAVAAFKIGRRLTSRNEKTLFWRLWGETSGTETRSIAVLVEWGDWRSFDREQNRRALARTLSRLVEVGYLKEATLTPDGESYRLVKATGHHFPPKQPKQIEGEKAPPGKAGGAARLETATGTKRKKAYRRKRRRQLLPRDGE